MKIRVTMDGKSVALTLPDSSDVEIDLTGATTASEPKPSPKMSDAGPAARKLFGWLCEKSNGDRVFSVDPNYIERDLGLVPVALGRVLGQLQRLGAVEIVHRKREDRGRVVAYKLKLLEQGEDSNVTQAEVPSPFHFDDLRHSHGDQAALLFAGLCCLAGPDGVVSASFQVVCDCIGAKVFPASKLDLLDREGWISLAEADGIVVCSIVGWQHVAENLEAIVSSLPKGEDVTDSMPSDADWGAA